jgi:alpha-tubulin suppressor-like RCC1 family protein
MTIGNCSLVDAVNVNINSLTDSDHLKSLQLAGVTYDFEQGFVSSVANLDALPSAACNRGRWFYVEDRCGYRWSDGSSWSNDFTSTSNESIIFAWGFNIEGQLGDGTTVDKSSPVSVVGGFTDWCGVSGGCRIGQGIRANGTLWAWGRGDFGMLGDNTNVDKSSPVSVVGGFTDWCGVSAGINHSLGVRTNGTAWAWGLGCQGRLGDGTTVSKRSPVSVVGGFTDWCGISAGTTHSLGVRTNCTIWAWGCNGTGRLGDNTTVDQSSPVSVVGGFTDWCGISGGVNHSVAIRNNGTIWSWGNNGTGRLGDDTTVDKSSPVSVVGGFTDWCGVSAGLAHGLGIRTNGSIWAWGFGGQGRLGDGTTVTKSSPVSVVGGFTDWCGVSAGYRHSIGIRRNGTIWAWGCNGDGRLGDGTTVDKSSPVSVIGGFANWCAISGNRSGYHSFGIRIAKGFHDPSI